MMEEFPEDLQIAIRFDPTNAEVKAELNKLYQLCNSACQKDREQSVTNICNNSIGSSVNGHGKIVFDPLNLG